MGLQGDADAAAVDYKATLNLPQTAFAMRAGLAQKEPVLLERWRQTRLFERLRQARAGGPAFVLHDGPPYANGALHHGHILNKVLKDMVLKDRAMSGCAVAYVPGWDCHGLPIEAQVDKQLGARKQGMAPAAFRAACRDYAAAQVAQQSQSFQRLGVLADWERPYLTMAAPYAAQTIRQFGRLHALGLLYKGLRPTHWCLHHRTALAEAEIEYAEHRSPSVHVAFAAVPESLPAALQALGEPLHLVIWTTTPWTLPANRAIAVHPGLTYLAYRLGQRICLVAEARLADFLQAVGAPGPEAAHRLARLPGTALREVRYRHPFLPGDRPVLLGEHVTDSSGTGCVHTAPAHGAEDFALGRAHGLPLDGPVDDRGILSAAAGPFAGQQVPTVNAAICAHLAASGHLLSPREASLVHRYPHCWRCHRPIIVRATSQWFAAMDRPLDGASGPTLRQQAQSSLAQVRWLPAWGKQRIAGMLAARPDWCLSRQRLWGVPVVMANCQRCHSPLARPELFEQVARRVEQEGTEIWFNRPLHDFIAAPRCATCGSEDFVKEHDILDVWFDAGSSFAAVLEGPTAPATGPLCDLVLEGSDQHRGWFHASLLVALCSRGAVPYRAALTHGFVVDGQGKKISKSLGNFVDPQKTIAQNGAELLRLWVGQEDHRDDIRLSPQILARLGESYRKVRNTLRFILGNLSGFDPQTDALPFAALPPLDQLAVARHLRCVEAVRAAYASYLFHQGVGLWIEQCTTELSAFYFDVLKDRLYASAAAGAPRRAAQTVLYLMGRDLLRLVAPVLCFTAEEAWEHLPHLPGDPDSIHLCLYPPPAAQADGSAEMGALRRAGWEAAEALTARFAPLLDLRRQANLALEAARQEKKVRASVQARLTVYPRGEAQRAALAAVAPAELADLCIVSEVCIGTRSMGPDEADFVVEVAPAAGERCPRCWLIRPEVGAAPVCRRCEEVLKHAA